MDLSGSHVALITPFKADGSVNFDKLQELIEFQIKAGTDGIVVLGTTGESSTMTHEEDEDVVRCALETVKGRCLLIAGAGSNDTQTAFMKSEGVMINDLYALCIKDKHYYKCPDLLHLTEEGYRRCAEKTAEAIREAAKEIK